MMRARDWLQERKSKLLRVGLSAVIGGTTYLVALSFLIDDKEKGIVGISLQIIVGIILVLDQIASHNASPDSPDPIRTRVDKIIQKPNLCAFLVTIVILPIVYSIMVGPTNQEDIWSAAGGITIVVILAWAMFPWSLKLLDRVIKKIRNRHAPLPPEKSSISMITAQNIAILLGALFVMLAVTAFLVVFSSDKSLAVQIPVVFFVVPSILTVVPLFLISSLYCVVYVALLMIKTIHNVHNRYPVWSWITLFLLWTWGGLLLLLKEIG